MGSFSYTLSILLETNHSVIELQYELILGSDHEEDSIMIFDDDKILLSCNYPKMILANVEMEPKMETEEHFVGKVYLIGVRIRVTVIVRVKVSVKVGNLNFKLTRKIGDRP